jgi:6-phosphogluconolactonase (cycloisomerase 2 family)
LARVSQPIAGELMNSFNYIEAVLEARSNPAPLSESKWKIRPQTQTLQSARIHQNNKMKNFFLFPILLALVLACGTNSNQKKDVNMEKSYQFLVGTYTENPQEGIHLVKFNPEKELLETTYLASEVENPSFITSNRQQNLVFAVEETGGENGGKVTSFRLNKLTERLEKINSVFTEGDHPCHLSLDPSEEFLVSSNYSGGNLTVIPVDSDGNLSSEVQVVQHSGSSIHPNRQQQPHVHSAVFHPEESKIFVGDLGTDQIYVYPFEKDSLNPIISSKESHFSVEPGSGPRHLTFNKEGNRLYLIHEITAEIGVYAYENGALGHLETHSLLPEDFSGEVGAAEVRISPDGNFLYASNRGDANDITVFKVEKETGKLTKIQNISSQGRLPRNFGISPDGEYLITGNQGSDNLVVFKRNSSTGKLETTDFNLQINKPVYLFFLEEGL